MESNARLFYRNDRVDLRIWPIFHFLSDEEIEDINVAMVFGSAGKSALYVTKKDEIFAIGSNEHNLLGLGDDNLGNKFKPEKVDQLCGKKIKYFSCGYEHVMALTEDGIVYNWGSNTLSQLGTKNPNDIVGPSIVGSLFGKKVIQIACCTYYNLVLCDNYEVYEWGNRAWPDKIRSNASVETLVQGELKGKEIVSVACTKNVSLALSKDGCVYSWGMNTNESSEENSEDTDDEDDNEDEIDAPTRISSLSKIFIKKIVAGGEHVLVLSDLGILYSWNYKNYSQLGAFSSDPAEIEFPNSDGVVSTGRIIDIAASPFSNISAAMDENCNVFMWGQCKDHTASYRPIISNCSKKMLIYEHIKSSFDDETTSDLTICVEEKEICKSS